MGMRLRKINLEKRGMHSFLSSLEADIMDLLWKNKKMRVRTIHSKLRKKRGIALTSVAVTMDRLYKKGLVKRDMEKGLGGIHYMYSPSKTRKQLERTILDSTIDKMIEVFGPSAVSYFDERFARRKK